MTRWQRHDRRHAPRPAAPSSCSTARPPRARPPPPAGPGASPSPASPTASTPTPPRRPTRRPTPRARPTSGRSPSTRPRPRSPRAARWRTRPAWPSVAVISVTFSEPLDPATVTGTSVTLSQRCHADRRRPSPTTPPTRQPRRSTPDSPLASSTTYTVSLDRGDHRPRRQRARPPPRGTSPRRPGRHHAAGRHRRSTSMPPATPGPWTPTT